MASEQSHRHSSDSTPLPPSTLLRHHPQPDGPEPLGLRHRLSRSTSQESQQLSSSSVRIYIQSPFGDSGVALARRKEGWLVSKHETIAKIKDDLASGRMEGAGMWDRDGMRIVYQGRIVRDHEQLGNIVGDVIDKSRIYTLHLVARRIATTPDVQLLSSLETKSNVNMSPVPMPAALANTSSSNNSIDFAALSDSIHFLLFCARYHLFKLLGREVLQWSNTVPAPIVSQEDARDAVRSVVGALAAQRERNDERWEQWELVFTQEDDTKLRSLWEKLGMREGVEGMICNLWSDLLWRKWEDRVKGENTEIELDGVVCRLHLPALSACNPAQLVHLLLYLRITSLIPLLNSVLYDTSHREFIPRLLTTTSNPPPIIRAPRNARVIYQRTFRLPLIPVPTGAVLMHIALSTVKVITMMWMLTRGMKWSDPKYWLIAGVGWGWWLMDIWGALSTRMRQRNINAIANDIANNAEVARENNARANRFVGNGHQRHVPPNANATAGYQRLPGFVFAALPPIVHLSTDEGQLLLRDPYRTNNTFAPSSRACPSWLQTQLFLPIALWFITLIPGWEAARARLIRKRERDMRTLVAGSNPDLPPPAGGELASEYVLPNRLSEQAKRYYERIIARDETIDWEEEREAQRVMGVREEN
ncbi:hypothetical protein L204_101679 [Cryptococcus depauperatus]|nr:hypothetical protein L204_04357 [Cryptococcus depauperatus CBS 7855]